MISCCLIPAVSLIFFCRYFRLSWKWSCYFAYTLLYIGLSFLEQRLPLPGILFLLPEICLPALAEHLFFHRPFRETLAFSTLVSSVTDICRGCIQCLIFWLAASLSPDTALLPCLDTIQLLLSLLLLSAALHFICKSFPLSLPGREYLLLLLLPVLFIFLTERTLNTSVYGNTIIWDSRLGLVYPVVEHMEILFLQIFAGLFLLAVLFIWRKFSKTLFLEQQIQTQKLYLEEARSRYEATRSFRHDIQNHLTVVRELLNTEKYQEACQYLSRLEETADALSYPVYTGIQAVDALLGSKSALAQKHQIDFHCELTLPETESIPDIDWCILLANALDNAVYACLFVPPALRQIQVCGSRKGNLYLLSVENTRSSADERPPAEGTGLFNIRSTAGKYGGTVQIHPSGNRFRLDILLVISN